MTIQSAISTGELVKGLLVPQNTTTFFNDGGINRFLVHQSTFSTRSPPISIVNALNGVKHLFHTFKYLKRAAIMESLINKVFIN